VKRGKLTGRTMLRRVWPQDVLRLLRLRQHRILNRNAVMEDITLNVIVLRVSTNDSQRCGFRCVRLCDRKVNVLGDGVDGSESKVSATGTASAATTATGKSAADKIHPASGTSGPVLGLIGAIVFGLFAI